MATAGDENHLFIDAELDRNNREKKEGVGREEENLSLYDVMMCLIKKEKKTEGSYEENIPSEHVVGKYKFLSRDGEEKKRNKFSKCSTKCVIPKHKFKSTCVGMFKREHQAFLNSHNSILDVVSERMDFDGLVGV